MIGDFVLAFLLVGGGLGFLFRKSLQKDRAEERKQQAAARQKAAAEQEEARKYQPGVPLVCLGCDTHFSGPLTDSGCPQCHLSSLVVTQDKLNDK